MEPYILKTKGPCVILAGAGTGKTHSIIQKLRFLISNKIYPAERIVCLTFSNEAVNTLRQRMLPYLKDKEPIIRTFHSFCADILRKHGEKINIKQNFKIILPDDGKILLHKYFKIHPMLCNKYVEEISLSKDLGKTLEENNNINTSSEEIEILSKKLEDLKFKVNTAHIKKISKSELDKLKIERDNTEENLKKSKFIQAWKSYEKIKSTRNGLDYADLHHKALELLTKFPEVTEEFDYIIVDEFQDTNKLQCLILEKLAINKNITVVGDLNQSIYRFRGAYDENFSYFKKIMDVKDSDIYNLDKSYRSTNKILEIAHELIKNNYKNKEECFKVKNAYNENGENIKIYELKNSKEEIRKIIEILKDELKQGTQLKEICIIFRTHQQSSMLKKQLEYEDIPYTSINRDSLLKTQVIKTVRAYLTILDKLIAKSKGGDGAWWDLIHNTLKNKNDELIFAQKIKSLKEEECMSLKLIEEKIQRLSEQGEIQIQTIIKNINRLLENKESPIDEITKKIFTFLSVEDNEESKKDELPTLEKFHAFVKEFVETDSKELSSLIHHLNTIDALDISIESPILIKDGIRIMTNHATKGLEYEVVIMSSLVQKKFPIERIDRQDEKENPEESLNKQIMEERRLCYVGFTRTKKRLYLTYAREYSKRTFQESQFLKEINYQNNPVIDFIKDEQELYQEPKEKTPLESSQSQQTNKKIIKFSPSSLQLFDECQKRYEMKYIYHMPDPMPQSWEAITIGNFIHRVLEQGVKNLCKTLKDFEDCAKIVQMEGYEDVNLNEATNLIKVFFERHNKKYNENSKTEQPLQTVINGLIFNGFADRIDISDNGELTIIDYKTGKSEIKPKYRNWQLGIYALASKQYGKPKTLILEMLQKEHPLEFIINEQGMAKEIHSPRTQFSLEEVKQEIVETAKNIMQARTTGFKACQAEKNCQFCEEWTNNNKE